MVAAVVVVMGWSWPSWGGHCGRDRRAVAVAAAGWSW